MREVYSDTQAMYVPCNNEERSRYHCYSAKARPLHIPNVCLLHKVTQHTKRMHRIMLSSVAYSGCATFLLVIS
jgi:hypothetical protein